MKNKRFGNGTPKRKRNLEQQLERSLHRFPAANGAHLQATIVLAEKEAAMRQNRQHISFARFCGKLMPRIGWKLWGVQGIFLLSACGILYDFSDDLKNPLRLAKLLLCLSVMVFMTALPFLYRSFHYRMQEIEAAAYFSSVKLLLAKLLVIGIGDLSLLGGIFLAALAKTSLSADSAVIYLCLPFLLSGSGCLFMLGHFPPGRFLAGSFLFCTALMLVFAVLPGQYTLLLHPSYSAAQAVLCVLSAGFCAYQLCYIIKISSYEEMQLT